MCRVDGEDLADNQPVEQHPDRREVQFDGRLGGRLLQHLDVSGDVNRLDVREPADLVALDPGKKVTRGPVIGHAGVLVADGRREKFKEALGSMVAGVGDHCRHDDRTDLRGDGPGGRFWDELVHGR